MNKLALIIEDDEDLALIFAEALRAVDYEVETIADGGRAQQRLDEVVPYLILLDMHLPHVSGADLLGKIRTDERLKGVTVIITTADARMAEMYGNMADFVMVKPISFVQLRDLTARLLQKNKK
ncbi:MAG: response regulator [Chloroflexota bacterium]